MKILFAKTFTKKYWKLPEMMRKRVDDTIDIFRHDPFTPSLRNHPLKGEMKHTRSLSAGFDLRIIFEEHDGYAIVIMIAVGTLGEVY